MSPKENLEQLFERFIFECRFSAQLSNETIRSYEATFSLFKSIMPEVTEVHDLRSEAVVEFFRRLQSRNRPSGKYKVKTGIKPATVRSYWSKLNTFFKWLQTNSALAKNPFAGLRQPRGSIGDKKELEEVVIRRIYSAITLTSQNSLLLRRDNVMVSLLLFCGLRRGELIGLEVQDIDIEKKLLIVRSSTSKSRKVRYIPIHPTLLLQLKEYIGERNRRRYKTHHLLVSSTADQGLTPHGLKHWVERMIKKTGTSFHLHQFRHSFACNLARKDVNAFKIQKLLGHSSLDMTMTYLSSIGTEELSSDISKLSI